MFARYTQDPRQRIKFYCIVALFVYAFLVYRTGWPTIEDVVIFVGLVFVLPFFPEDLQQRVRQEIPFPESVSTIMWDLVLFGVVFFLAMVFFAQFVLPLKHTRERFYAALRLFAYIFGKHGPAIFINDGRIVRGERELEKTGYGVVLLDTASAAVLRTSTKVTRPVGPGVAFLGRREKVLDIVDLHRQRQFIGPRDKENPFNPEQEPDETEEDFTQRQARRWETSAMTRDGVEVVPNIYVLFQLERLPENPTGGQKKPATGFEELLHRLSRRETVESGFGYNPEAVMKAISHIGVDPEESFSSDQRKIPWHQLPAYLAAEVWREHLRKFTFDQLFASPTTHRNDRNQKTAFELISEAVQARMKQEIVEPLDDFGNPTHTPTYSLEYQLLKDRGIEVLAALILNPRFESHVNKKLFEQWKANWEERIRERARLVEQDRTYAAQKGTEIALVNFADAASRLLGSQLPDLPPPEEAGTQADTPASTGPTPEAERPDLDATLEYLIRGTLDQCLRDPQLLPKLTVEKQELAYLIEWVRSN